MLKIKSVCFLSLFVLFGCNNETVVKEVDNNCNDYDLLIKGRNIVLSYDDTPIEDLDKLLPLHQEFGIPGEVGIWLNKISDFSGASDQLTIQNLHDIRDFGFELVSHTTYHTSLGEATLLKSAKKGDDKIRTNIDSTFQHAPNLTSRYELVGDAIQYVKIKRIGSDSNGTFIQLSKPLLFDFPTYSKLKISTDVLEEEIVLSNNYLENVGIHVEHISYPFGLVDTSTIGFLKNNFVTGRLAIPSRNWEVTSFIYEDKIEDEFKINSLDFSHASYEYLEKLFSSSNSDNAFMMLFTHSWDDKFTQEKLSDIVELAHKYNWNFSTRTKSLGIQCQD